MKPWSLRLAVWFMSVAFLGISGCRGQAPANPAMDATQAHQTVQALVTQGMASPAGDLGTPMPVSSPTHTAYPGVAQTQAGQATVTPRPTSTKPSPSPTAACDRAGAGSPLDVTIPDDTVFAPEEPFTKIWRLVNVGTCTWTRRYAARFFYGSLMAAPDVVYLSQDVLPGQIVEIAVDLVAPATPGVHQGNWKLQNADGELFGIGPNGDAPFWVRIIVELPASPTVTQTPTPTTTFTPTPLATATATATPTPPVASSGSVTLQNNQVLDLDTGSLDNGEAGDVLYRLDEDGFHVLAPQDGTEMGVFGLSEPGLEACQAAGMSTAPLALESLTTGTYLCYQTDQSLFGWLRYTSLDVVRQSVSLDFQTWAAP